MKLSLKVGPESCPVEKKRDIRVEEDDIRQEEIWLKVFFRVFSKK